MESFDLIVIGGGSAGYAAARTARERCPRVAIIDGSEELGGLCILRGCMPSKTLIYSAEILHHARKGALFGLDIPDAKADMSALHARKLRMIDDFKGYRQEQLNSDRFTLFREKARFIDEKTVQLVSSGKTLTASAFVITTGSVVNWPAVPGLDIEGIWTSDDVLDLDRLPGSVIVLGGGVVACELAQFLKRIGSEVTQIQRSPQILKEESGQASEVIRQAFIDEGIQMITGTRLTRVEKISTGFAVEFLEAGNPRRVEADHLLNAMGRRAATSDLGLAEAGVALRENGQIRVNASQQSTNPSIYAAGDVCGPFEIVHIAIMQGETAARHAVTGNAPAVDLDSRTSVVFTDPQIGSAGLPIEEAKARGFDLVIAEYPFDDHGKSILMEARRGFVKVWADRRSGRIVGAECVGRDASELIHSMAVAVRLKARISELAKVHWYHPTLSEIWSYPLEDILEELA